MEIHARLVNYLGNFVVRWLFCYVVMYCNEYVLVRFAVESGAEEIFVEPVNLRGRGAELTQQALASSGYKDEAVAVESIRTNKGWSRYTTQLISNVQRSVRKLYDISHLRFLLYPSRLTEEDVAQIRQDDAGVVWL